MIKVIDAILLDQNQLSLRVKGSLGEFSIIYDLKTLGLVQVGRRNPEVFREPASFTQEEFKQVTKIIDDIDGLAKSFHRKLEAILNEWR